MSTEEFNRSGDRRIRLISWSTVLLLAGIALFALYGAHSASRQVNAALTWLAVLIVVGAIVGARSLAVRLGLKRVQRDLVFELTNKGLVRRRSGWPDVRIGFSEISTLYERHGWLVVESVEPRRKIAVPKEVEGFLSLRAELAKHSPIIVPPRRSLLRLVPMIASFLCWGLVLWSKDAVVLRIAGTIAVILLAWESFRLTTQLRHSPKRLFLWTFVGLGWVTAALVVYLRVLRG